MFIENVFVGVLIIFTIRVFNVALATLRFLLMGRAKQVLIATLAFFEALSFAITFGLVAQDLTNIPNLMAYSVGFAAGTYLGLLIEAQVGMGYATVTIVSRGYSLPIVESIRDAGFGATRTPGEGTSGSVGFVWVVVRRRNVGQILELAHQLDKDAFVTVNETRTVRRGFLGYGRS